MRHAPACQIRSQKSKGGHGCNAHKVQDLQVYCLFMCPVVTRLAAVCWTSAAPQLLRKLCKHCHPPGLQASLLAGRQTRHGSPGMKVERRLGTTLWLTLTANLAWGCLEIAASSAGVRCWLPKAPTGWPAVVAGRGGYMLRDQLGMAGAIEEFAVLVRAKRGAAG
jgi:hypothetical protein